MTTGLHDWWYRWSARGDVVPTGTTPPASGCTRRDTQTGNLKAVQKLLGHSSIRTTADIYTDWDIAQLAETMRGVRAQDEA